MKVKIILAVPTTSGPNPKGWKTVSDMVVEAEDVSAVLKKVESVLQDEGE